MEEADQEEWIYSLVPQKTTDIPPVPTIDLQGCRYPEKAYGGWGGMCISNLLISLVAEG